jgi:hypothetical protein
VPIVKIDFGNGRVITRTLHGNIASYVCTSQGRVLDVLPGIYNPTGFTDALDQLRILNNNLAFSGPREFDLGLASYHQNRAEALKKGVAPARLVDFRAIAPVGKAMVERRIERLVAIPGARIVNGGPETVPPPEDLAAWKALEEDTRLNEKARRQLIHEMLARKTNTQPSGISKWLYKEVLHADLDDPYLGLGPVLFAGYPFRAEEGK